MRLQLVKTTIESTSMLNAPVKSYDRTLPSHASVRTDKMGQQQVSWQGQRSLAQKAKHDSEDAASMKWRLHLLK